MVESFEISSCSDDNNDTNRARLSVYEQITKEDSLPRFAYDKVVNGGKVVPDEEILSLLWDDDRDRVDILNGDGANKSLIDLHCCMRFWGYLRIIISIICLIFIGFFLCVHVPVSSEFFRIRKLPIKFDCPKSVERSRTDHDNNMDIYKIHFEENFLSGYRRKKYGGWDTSYRKMKQILRPWKKHIIETAKLQPGDSIYESAMGRGFNLLITAEVLNELLIDGVFVYGNDYLSDSIRLAKSLWKLPEISKLPTIEGIYCTADSTHLDFIPDNSFDLVFTGYLEPLSDPSHLDPNGSINADIENCLSNNSASIQLSISSQNLQEQWYLSWVMEMVRITKPGKYIAVEMTGYPLCQSNNDWGGVSKAWWKSQAHTLGVYSESIYIFDCEEALDLWKVGRYHILMKKVVAPYSQRSR